MNARTRRFVSRLTLGGGILLAALWLGRLDFSEKISLNITDLIPQGDHSPELELARQFAGDRLSRVLLVSLTFPADAGGDDVAKASEAFSRSLDASRAIAEAARIGDPALRDAFGAYLLEHRFELLLPGWLANRKAEYEAAGKPGRWVEWLAARSASDLENFLGTPEAMAFEELVPVDPLLLLPALSSATEGLAGQALFADNPSGQLFWVLIDGSALDPELQSAVADAMAGAEREAQAVAPGTAAKWTGVARFAAYSRERIKSEVLRLNILSVLAVLAVGALCLRRAGSIVHALPVVLCSLLAAWVVTTALVPRVHIVVLVIGALLCGIAIDYSFHVMLHRGPGGGGYAGRLRGVYKPLLTGALTSVVGFSFLLISELPFIRHLGVFVTVGLLAALAAALLWFAQFDGAVGELRGSVDQFARRGSRLFWRSGAAARPVFWVTLAVGVAVIGLGLFRIEWRDDIRELEIASPELYQNDAELRAAFGQSGGRTTWFSSGRTIAEARSAQRRFAEWARQTHPESRLASIASALPSSEEVDGLRQSLPELAEFVPKFRAQLEERGFDAESFDPFFADFEKFLREGQNLDSADVIERFEAALPGPLAVMMETTDELAWVATVGDLDPDVVPPPETSTISGSQLESLNRVFRQYRKSASRLALIGAAVAALAVILLYGPRRSLSVLFVPAMACVFAVSVLGLVGHTLNLFHLLAVFLGACLSFDYAAFASEARLRGEAPPGSIILSALTTLASFGVLATSSIPVVSALGITVSIVVVSALLIIEVFWPANPRG